MAAYKQDDRKFHRANAIELMLAAIRDQHDVMNHLVDGGYIHTKDAGHYRNDRESILEICAYLDDDELERLYQEICELFWEIVD